MKNQDLFIRKIIVAFLFMVGFTASGILAQQNMTVKTQASDDEAAKKAEAFLAQWDKNDMPGGAVGVVKDGRLVYKRGFGMANLDYDVPNTTSTTLFNLASASKPFTAMSIALLAQQGKFRSTTIFASICRKFRNTTRRSRFGICFIIRAESANIRR
jgi:CubicO group peptidase (beta-lactamase class C family)